ncbi:hypothetical protein GCM10022235_00320 [Kribbella ginsengisoli]|uniref:Uncharacterized protein n=2 Tax=Kribbella ginsengisoli TaxID=363865 RepID=A0ABP6VJ42_9ACTN
MEEPGNLRRSLRTAAQGWTEEYQSHGRTDLLLMGMDTFRWLVASAEAGPELDSARSDLFVGLQLQYGWSGQPEMLDEAIDLGTAVVAASQEGPPRARQESNLANALRLRFEATGERRDLDESIARARRGLEATLSPAIQAQRWSNLALSLRSRYELLERRQDLADSLDGFRRARDLAAETEPQRSRIGSNLAVVMRLKGTADRDRDLLRDAVELAMASVTSEAAYPADRSGFLINAALACVDLHQLTGATDALDLGISLLGEAAAIVDPGDPDLTLILLNSAYATRVKATLESADAALLDVAVTAAADVLSVSRSESPDRALALAGLGRAYWLRFQRRLDRQDGQRAVESRLQAARQPFGSAAARAQSGQLAGQWSMELGDARTATDGYARAVDLLREVAWSGLRRTERERGLIEFAGLACDAMAAAVAAGRCLDALAFVEHGRSVLWDDGLQQREVATLQAEAPELADRLVVLRERLDVLVARGAAELRSEDSS